MTRLYAYQSNLVQAALQLEAAAAKLADDEGFIKIGGDPKKAREFIKCLNEVRATSIQLRTKKNHDSFIKEFVSRPQYQLAGRK